MTVEGWVLLVATALSVAGALGMVVMWSRRFTRHFVAFGRKDTRTPWLYVWISGLAMLGVLAMGTSTTVVLLAAGTLVVVGLAPWFWTRRHNRGLADPRAGRSRVEDLSRAPAQLLLAGMYVGLAMDTAPADRPRFYILFYLGGAVFVVSAIRLVLHRERTPTIQADPPTAPGVYDDLVFQGQRFWNGSAWFDGRPRTSRYRRVPAAWWGAYAVLAAAFVWMFGSNHRHPVMAAVVISSVICGVLAGGAVMLWINPLLPSPRDAVPPVDQPRHLAYPDWLPDPERSTDEVTELRWWDGTAWTDWTYSLPRA